MVIYHVYLGGIISHLLTEDIQFSVECAINCKRIGYCDAAIIFDEQPSSIKQSWKQRLRWSKGFYQIDIRYLGSLITKIFSPKNKNKMSCYDTLMTIAPGMFLTLAVLGINIYMLFAASTYSGFVQLEIRSIAEKYLILAIINFYLGMLGLGCITVWSEWDRIPCTPFEKVKYLWAFPLYMFSYVPIALCALVEHVKWDPIKHHSCVELSKKI